MEFIGDGDELRGLPLFFFLLPFPSLDCLREIRRTSERTLPTPSPPLPSPFFSLPFSPLSDCLTRMAIGIAAIAALLFFFFFPSPLQTPPEGDMIDKEKILTGFGCPPLPPLFSFLPFTCFSPHCSTGRDDRPAFFFSFPFPSRFPFRPPEEEKLMPKVRSRASPPFFFFFFLPPPLLLSFFAFDVDQMPIAKKDKARLHLSFPFSPFFPFLLDVFPSSHRVSIDVQEWR